MQVNEFEPPRVYLYGPDAARYGRARLTPGRWEVITGPERLRGLYGGIFVRLDGYRRDRWHAEATALARRRGMYVVDERDLCQHTPPCAMTDPSYCWPAGYVARASTFLTGIDLDDPTLSRPGLVARVREHRAAEATT